MGIQTPTRALAMHTHFCLKPPIIDKFLGDRSKIMDFQVLKYPTFRAHAMRPYKFTVLLGIIYFLVFP
jgi:hypothetical protein